MGATNLKRYVEYEEATGRTVKSLRYWHSPEGGQAVSILFVDDTRIHIAVTPLLRVKAEFGSLHGGDLRIHRIYPTILGPLVR
jgi:hypothetical protein